MNSLFSLLQRVTRDLEADGVPWALIGGLGVGARTEPRFTRDLDLALAVENDLEAEAISHLLLGRGYRISALLEQTSTGRLATIRLLSPGDSRLVDLLFASCGIEPEIVKQAELMEIAPGIVAYVAQVGHLIATKVLARDDQRRPQDKIDLVGLLGVASEQDKKTCRVALSLIASRGFNRGRDLCLEFENLILELGY